MGRARFLVTKLLPLMIAFWVFVWLPVSLCNVYYGVDDHMQVFNEEDSVSVKVNSLTSTDTMLPFSYYSLPFCKPPEGIKMSGLNLGQKFLGDQVVNSPYLFRINVNESVYLCTTEPLTADEARRLNQWVIALYQVNMILDNLPVITFRRLFDFGTRWSSNIGFPLGYGYSGTESYILNHLKFRVLLHEEGQRSEKMGTDKPNSHYYTIVGFEVVPASMKRDLEAMLKLEMYDAVEPFHPFDWLSLPSQAIRDGERVSFTYEVEFLKSNVSWSSRWGPYLKSESDWCEWYVVVIFLVFATSFCWRVRKEQAEWKEFPLLQDQCQDKEELWQKLEIQAVFREPPYYMWLCVMVGNGVQMAVTAIGTVLFALLGVLSPVSSSLLFTVMVYYYILSGIVGGYISVLLWGAIKSTFEGWRTISYAVSCIFPGIMLLILTAVKFILASKNSTAGMPVHLYVLLLWFCMAVPFTVLGGFLASKAPLIIEFPVKNNHISITIPTRKIPSWLQLAPFWASWLRSSAVSNIFSSYRYHVALCGIYPSFLLCALLVSMFVCHWMGIFYNMFGFLLLGLLLFIIICAQLSALLTFLRLRAGDCRWWWNSFFAPGAAAIYIFIFASVSWFLLDGTASVMVYIGYSLIIAVAIMLCAGATGFLSSLYIVYYIGSLVKVH